jgi:hypothetical protein
MNDAQLQQLIGVIRAGGGGGHKTSRFSSAEGTAQNGKSGGGISNKHYKSMDGRTRGVNERRRQPWSPLPPSSPPTSPALSRPGPSKTCSTSTKLASSLPPRDNWLLHNSRRRPRWMGNKSQSGMHVQGRYLNALFQSRTSKIQDSSSTNSS